MTWPGGYPMLEKPAVPSGEQAMRPLLAAFIMLSLLSGFAVAQDRSSATNLVANCDRLAASPYDSSRPPDAVGVAPDKLDPKIAIPACEAALNAMLDNPRIMFQLGRAYSADGNYAAAAGQYAAAQAKGHVYAAISLASLYES